MKKAFGIIVFAALILVLGQAGVAHAAVSDWKFGANVKPYSPTDYGSPGMDATLKQLKNDGANYVVLIIPFYTDNRTSTDMKAGWDTPTDDSLIHAIDTAHEDGLHVMLMPHLETDYIEWRGNINPALSDRDLWFANYTNMITHYAALGQAHGVEDFALGAELLHMTNTYYDPQATDRWVAMINAVRQVFKGKVTYSANREFEVEVIGFWDKLDYVGLSAYYDLYHAQDSSVPELEKSWDNWRKGVIEPLQQKIGKDIVFTEIGYRSLDGTYRNPWDWQRDGTYTETDQANEYEALFDYWKDVPWMKGVYLWRYEVNTPAPGAGEKGYTPQNKVAEKVIQKWFANSSTAVPVPIIPSVPNPQPPAGEVTQTTPVDAPATPPAVAAKPIVLLDTGAIVTPQSQLDVWWPTDGATVSGLQPFKAMITYSNVGLYDIYWSVDDGVWNKMYDSATDYPHKEAEVDLSPWNWGGGAGGNGPYKISFMATDKSGNVLLKKTVNVSVWH